MTTPLICAVISCAPQTNPVALSIETAKATGMGPFSQIVEHVLVCKDEPLSDFDRFTAGVQAAQAHGAHWILFIDCGETLRPDAFVLVAPALRIHDVIWGAASLYKDGHEVEHVLRKSRLACQNYEDFFHLALTWWIGKSYFIKTDCAVLRPPLAPTPSWWMRHLLDLWQNSGCFKTAQPLTIRQTPVPELGHHDRALLVHNLDAHPIYRTVHGGAHDYKLPYTGRNPVIEREQTRGLFYEQDELAYLAHHIGPGAVLVDVGANTGNHTVFFAAVMAAKKVIPIEPAPHAIQALKRAVLINTLTNVDLSKLGVGAGGETGSFRLNLSPKGGLGATSLMADPTGNVQVLPLDALITEPVDVLKIDVESMELSVLDGAKALIAQYRPLIFIEIADQNTDVFLAWIDATNYQIDKIFPDKTHVNYLISPLHHSESEAHGGSDF